MAEIKTPWGNGPSGNADKDSAAPGIKRKIERQYHRVKLDSLNKVLKAPVAVLHARLTSDSHGVLEGMILDISANGCRIAIPIQMQEGDPIKISFTLNGRSIHSKATVRWVVKHSHIYFAGMEFQGMPDINKQFLWALSEVSKVDSLDLDKMKDALR